MLTPGEENPCSVWSQVSVKPHSVYFKVVLCFFQAFLKSFDTQISVHALVHAAIIINRNAKTLFKVAAGQIHA